MTHTLAGEGLFGVTHIAKHSSELLKFDGFSL